MRDHRKDFPNILAISFSKTLKNPKQEEERIEKNVKNSVQPGQGSVQILIIMLYNINKEIPGFLKILERLTPARCSLSMSKNNF